jgi:hypothetical protein
VLSLRKNGRSASDQTDLGAGFADQLGTGEAGGELWYWTVQPPPSLGDPYGEPRPGLSAGALFLHLARLWAISVTSLACRLA